MILTYAARASLPIELARASIRRQPAYRMTGGQLWRVWLTSPGALAYGSGPWSRLPIGTSDLISGA